MKPLLFLLILLFFESTSCKSIKGISFFEEKDKKDEKVIVTITTDDEYELNKALFYLYKLGGTIYIDTPIINFKNYGSLSVTGTLEGGIVGIKQSNGEYPILNFQAQRDSSTSFYSSGLSVVASNKIIKNLIIESAGSYGIFINGQKNIIDHVITRYNGQSGIYISSGSEYNTFNYCYSYRNFHFLENNLIADGFTIEIGAINNIFNNCFAWENSQNGFGYYYWNGKNKNGEITYTHSGSWNNGNMDVFSGKYDFDNGNPLDKKLWTIQQIIKSNKDFENNYNNNVFNLDSISLNSNLANEYFSNYNLGNNGSGFNFGHEKIEESNAEIRVVDYCVSFDHISKGFNNNGSKNFTAFITNTVGFNNNMNYELPFMFNKWSNNWSWGSKEEDNFGNEMEIKRPDDSNSAKKDIYSVRDQITKVVYANKFPEDINFDKVIKSLKSE